MYNITATNEKATKFPKLHNPHFQIYFFLKKKSIYIAMFLQKTWKQHKQGYLNNITTMAKNCITDKST